MFRGFGLLALIVLLLLTTPANANHLPAPSGFVNDFAGVLTLEQRASLEQRLTNYSQTNSHEIAIALMNSLNGEDVADFTVKAFEEWGVGKKDQDDGVLILASIEDRVLRIEVGYGLEGSLTDGEAGAIIREVITPQFKEQNYFIGLDQGLSAIEGELSDSSSVQSSGWNRDFIEPIFSGLVGIYLGATLIIYLASYLARTKSIWLGGLIGVVLGVVIGWVVASLVVAALSAALLGVLGLILDWLLSRTYRRIIGNGGAPSWWSSGGGFWGGSKGGGFGGFGGGFSGGGGASGRW